MEISFYNTNITGEAKNLVKEVLDSGFISAGSMAERFEDELKKTFGFPFPVTVNSGTSALHLSLILAGVGPGDEVILPAQTFIATGLAVLMCNARPVFADIQLDTGNIDPESILKKITHKTKAIIPVHWSGYPCDMDDINSIAREYGLKVVEDAAHAFGATYKQQQVGTLSDFTAFSFQAIKHLTTGDGGLVCCSNEKDFIRARRLRWFDIDRDNSSISELGEREYDAVEIGYKYHMNDLSAAIGVGNLLKIKEILSHHRKLAELYTEGLKHVPGITLMNYKEDRESSWWFFQFKIENRDSFIKRMKEKNIPVSVVHQRIDKYSLFGGIKSDLTNQKHFNDIQICLPVHSRISESKATEFINEISKGWF